MSEYIKCSELVDFIADYISGELPVPSRVEFERHLDVCPPCQTYLKTYRDTIAMSRQAELGGPEVASAVEPIPEELVKAILAARAKS